MKFIFGRPIDEPFDREEEIKALNELISRNQPTAVLGIRRIGKTSIILNVLKNQNIPKIYINVEDFIEGKSIDIIGLFSYFSSSLLSEAIKFMEPRKRIPIVLKEKGEEAIKTLREILGYIKINFNINLGKVEIFLDSTKKGGIKESLKELLDLPQEISENINKKILIVLDEFQYLKLGEQNFPGLFHSLRSKWQFQNNVEYVISGSAVGMLENIFKKNQPFYQFFFPIYIKPFCKDKSEEFLSEGFQDEGKTFLEDGIKKAVEYLDGIPAWLNYFGIKSVLECRTIDEKCANKVIEDIYKDPVIQVIIKDEYNKLGKNARKILKFIANKGGEGNLRGIELSRSSINEGIKSLFNEGYIERKDRGVYRIIDPIMSKIVTML
ncbi:AAA family ATPase [Acidianus brierleyi]|uniref:ATP-binding protein n=1 Tax=Acidianus brierleyi TaxID=41673 RepID=A0A2U9IGV4_9CREN|nr:ATP-binding protein [Acidianus brierleyi]AWR95277.1 ATP-binding protein [Acidianus brierleyi]